MRLTRCEQQIVFTLSAAEARFLRRILQALIRNYKVPPQEFDAQAAAAWYSTRGCVTAKLSPEETREWLQHLHQFRGARLALLERCLPRLSSRQGEETRLPISVNEAPDLMVALNDHRLLLAAQNDIGETEMSERAFDDWLHLQPNQYQALAEIHLLAQIIDELLRLFAPEAASWPEATDWRPGDPLEE